MKGRFVRQARSRAAQPCGREPHAPPHPALPCKVPPIVGAAAALCTPQVHFELTGAGGSSGVLHPAGTTKSFGAGRVDIFEFPHLGALGELQSARVGTDGSGFFPAWHLQLLVVTHLPTGRVWQFRWGTAGGGGRRRRRQPTTCTMGRPVQSLQRGMLGYACSMALLPCLPVLPACLPVLPACQPPATPLPCPLPPPVHLLSCFNWIDKKVNYSRWLTLDSTQQGAYGVAAGSSTKLAAWQFSHKPPALVATSPGGSAAPGSHAHYPPQHHRGAGAPTSHYSPHQRPGSPQGGSPLRFKAHHPQQQQTGAASRPGSPGRVLVQGRQQWGGGSPMSPHTMARSGGGSLPGSPLIGARRPGSGR